MPSIGMRIAALIAAVVTTAVVGSCGESAPTPEAKPSKHNAADVTFADKMIPHHQQALEMAAMVPSRTTNRDLIILAKHIALVQQVQVDTLQGLLHEFSDPATT